MSASSPHRLIYSVSLTLPLCKPSAAASLLPSSSPSSYLIRFFRSSPPSPMAHNNRGKAPSAQQWKEKPRPSVGAVASQIGRLRVAEGGGGQSAARARSYSPPLQSGPVPPAPARGGPQGVWKPKNYTTTVRVDTAGPEVVSGSPKKEDGVSAVAVADLMKLFKGGLGSDFVADDRTFTQAEIRATFYPKFENEKSDLEVRTRMIDIVSHGQATLEVSLKHSGSLFMYAGHKGGAYAKNSFGNIYTAVGVFVLGRTFLEAWGTEARRKQVEFNDFLERNRICLSMELVTAVLGDHGQRPIDDYVVVTAVTELGHGKPKFYSTPELIAFCRKWRLPTNQVWLFSTRKSVTSFFAAYDALYEEGTATPVCKALDEVANISVPGSKDHVKVQGEILEGLVARIVSHDSLKHMEKVLKEFVLPPLDGIGHDLGPSLRDICSANRSDEKQQIKALLENAGSSMCPEFVDWFGTDSIDNNFRNADRSVVSKFLQAHPTDFPTTKLQEMIRVMRQRHFPAAFKCYCNFHKINSLSRDNLHLRMVIHVYSDSVFRRYPQEMRRNRGLWPLYRGFFVDINLFKASKDRADELMKDSDSLLKNINGTCDSSLRVTDGLADENENLMIKLKFLTYKLRTFLIRNGLSILFKDGPSAYKTYYLRQMKSWGVSPAKQRELSKMLDEWAVYIRRKCGNRQLSSSTYLSEAEPFLELYAKRSPQNQALIGAAGNLVRAENFLALIEGSRDEEVDLHPDGEKAPTSPAVIMDTVPKNEGLIIFFPGIPGCAKSALCKEILNKPGVLGDDRPVHSLMGDLIKGRYWPKVADEQRKKPFAITLADKNAPNEEVWRQIEDMCRSTKASAVPVVPDAEGTESNPFSLDALAVFIFRVLQRVNHPGNLDKNSPNAGYVLLMFYHLYEGKNRKEFESELYDRFGALVKMPLLKADRKPLPDPVRIIIEEGINLYRLHSDRHGRLEPFKGSYAKEWTRWEKRLREVLFAHADYINSIQVPFDVAVKHVLEQLKDVAKGEAKTPDTETRKFGNIVFAAVTLPVVEVASLLDKLAEKDRKVKDFLSNKNLEDTLKKAHVTLAHKRSHGASAVASYAVFLKQQVPVYVTALLFSDKAAALEVELGSVNGERISAKNEWPHVTIWTAAGVAPKEANMLPNMLTEGKAIRVAIDPPVTTSGILDFY